MILKDQEEDAIKVLRPQNASVWTAPTIISLFFLWEAETKELPAFAQGQSHSWLGRNERLNQSLSLVDLSSVYLPL